MRKKAVLFFTLFVTLLFAFACAYSLFDKVREADFLSDSRYEDCDIEGVYAEKASNLDGMLVSAGLFPPSLDTSFEFLPSYFSEPTHLVTTFSALRC
jgi:hypothetical protein